LNRFGNVFALHPWIAFQIGNRSGYLQDSIMGAGAQALLLHGSFQQAFAIGIQFAISSDLG
jgi:hypothetical protein